MKFSISNFIWIFSLVALMQFSFLSILKGQPKLDSAYIQKEIDEYQAVLQKPQPKPFMNLEFYGGLNYSLIDRQSNFGLTADIPDNLISYGLGFNFGMNASIILGKRFEYALGIAYSNLKSSYSANYIWSSSFLNTDYDESIQYFDIPITLKYFLVKRKSGIYMLVGFNNSFLMGAKMDAFYYGTSTIIAENVDISTLRKNWMGSLILGAGWEYKWEKSGIFLEVRYLHGLNNISKETKGLYYDSDPVFNFAYWDPSSKVQNFQFNIGYKLLIFNKTP